MKLRPAVLVAALALLASHDAASGTGPGGHQPPPPVDMPPPPTDTTVPSANVGYLPGSSSVTPTGQYTYSVPIEVPPGRGGVVPDLALRYNSRAGNGLVGVGWSLAGLSFAVYTFANLAPRAFSNHAWYREKFADYPRGRRALIPFVL